MDTLSQIWLTSVVGSEHCSICMGSSCRFLASDVTDFCVSMMSSICDHVLLMPFWQSRYRMLVTTQQARMPRCRWARQARRSYDIRDAGQGRSSCSGMRSILSDLLFSYLRIFGHFGDSIWGSNPPKTYQNNLYIGHKNQQERKVLSYRSCCNLLIISNYLSLNLISILPRRKACQAVDYQSDNYF